MSARDYKKLEQRDHIYKIPDTYVGSDEKEPRDERVWVNGALTSCSVQLPEAVERVFLEILSNAGDNVEKSRREGIPMKKIEVTMNNTTITVRNGGRTIPIEEHPDEKMWVPEMIFGYLLTSSNYEGERIGCGRNGYGAKLTNIFSKHFIVEVGDSKRGLSYKQEWKENMTIRGDPQIKKYKGENYVKVTYTLDFKRFGYESYDDEAYALFSRHCADIGFTCKVDVSFNDTLFSTADAKEYVKLIVPEAKNVLVHHEWPDLPNGTTIKDAKKDWSILPTIELCIVDAVDLGCSISFVNGIPTKEGGVHLNSAHSALVNPLLDYVNGEKKSKGAKTTNTTKTTKTTKASDKDEKKKLIKLKPSDVTPHFIIILNCRLTDPKFKSQSKTVLASPKPKITLKESELSSIAKWDAVNQLFIELDSKRNASLAKSDGKKNRHISIPKADDANEAGSSRSHKCTLYVVEGKSASGYATVAVSMLEGGKDWNGILPIQGKLLNVMNATPDKILENKEIAYLKKMLGLREGLDYSVEENFSTLRYGSLVILADADNDGKHIIGLILNFFHCRFPSLLKRGFVYYLKTPIIRAFKGKQTENFFSLGEYIEWKERTNLTGWKIHYFKGLGSSKDEHIKMDLEDPYFVSCMYDDNAEKNIKLAFDEKLSDNRKDWIADWEPVIEIEERMDSQPISEFINKELVEFSFANLHRSVPRLLDGLKPSQRKAVYGAFIKWGSKNGIKANCEQMKVAQFSSLIIEKSQYHHGNKSMEDTIVGMAQDFVGSNNMPYFTKEGQFGTRVKGGKDASSSRYIFTKPAWWMNYVYRPEDTPLLNYLEEEGEKIEPEVYLPIIPLCLVNGSQGIGTGHSTFVPCHNPLDLVTWLKKRLQIENGSNSKQSKKGLPKVIPWYLGFVGTISIQIRAPRDDNEDENLEGVEEEQFENSLPSLRMVTEGLFNVKDGKCIITELPIGRWTSDYKQWLDSKIESKDLRSYRDISQPNTVHFELTGFSHPETISLRLRKSYGLTNMVLFDKSNHPMRYDSTNDILEAFFEERFPYYELRKKNMIDSLNAEIADLSDKQRFIELVRDGKIQIIVEGKREGRKKDEIHKDMDKYKIPRPILDVVKLNHFTAEKLSKLRQKITELTTERDRLQKITPAEFWMNDLNEFDQEYKRRSTKKK